MSFRWTTEELISAQSEQKHILPTGCCDSIEWPLSREFVLASGVSCFRR